MEYLTKILPYFFTFIAGLGAGWTLKVVVSNSSVRKSRNISTSQRYNDVGGDMAGGDIHKNNKV